MSFTLPAVPKGHSAPAFQPLSAPSTSAALLPVGPAFFKHASRVLNQRSFEDEDALLAAEQAKNGVASDDGDDVDGDLGGEQEDKQLLASDPKLWKQQDHYAVLGLQGLRWKATDEQIKKAHRRKVLRHHPDKKASANHGHANDDSFFKCIAKAMEVLSNQEKRRQFDSVDEAIDDDDVPEAAETTADNFYELWAPVFAREGRFSKAQPVPELGGPETAKAEVERFYDFWYSIDSWRSFEYLDKDSPEGTDSRDEKRHQEKKNKAERANKKKADIARVRGVVDRALTVDPRIKAFKAAEKAARDAKKGKVPGQAVDPKVAAEEKRKAEEEQARLAKEEADKAAADKTSREAAKKAKAAAAKNVKKDRKAISALVTGSNYFLPAGTAPSLEVVEGTLTELDRLFAAQEPEVTAEMKKEADAAKEGAALKAVLAKYAAQAGGDYKQLA